MSPESKKIILFSTAFRPLVGGSEIASEEIAKRLADIDFEIITSRFYKKNKKEEFSKNIHIHRLGLGSRLDKYLLPVLGYFKAKRIIENVGDDNLNSKIVIHAYQASYGAMAAYLLKLSFPGINFVLTLQEGKKLEDQNVLIKIFRKRIIEKADKITTISRYLSSFASNFKNKAEPIVIPNGVDSGLFKKMDLEGRNARARLGVKEDERIILTISRLVQKNGVDILIKAFNILNNNKDNPKTKLIIIGSGLMLGELEDLVSSFNLSDRVVFVGEVYYEDLPIYLSAADVFVRPSLSEGLGNAFLEAMATGVPIIGTPVGGIVDFLEDGRTGLFCAVNDPGDLAKKINLILADVDLRKRLIENGRDLVKQKYDWQIISEKFRKIYQG